MWNFPFFFFDGFPNKQIIFSRAHAWQTKGSSVLKWLNLHILVAGVVLLYKHWEKVGVGLGWDGVQPMESC